MTLSFIMGRSPCSSKNAELNGAAWTAQESFILNDYNGIHGNGGGRSVSPAAFVSQTSVLRAKDEDARRKKQDSTSLPPGPVPWPFVGNLPEVLWKAPAYKWIHSLFKLYATPILCVRLGSVHVIAVDSPDIAREFLKKHDAVFASRPITMGSWYSSRGFLSVAVVPWGDQWKKMRRVVASEVMSAARLSCSHGKRKEEADNLVRYVWNQSITNKTQSAIINVRHVLRHYSANVIRRLVFNTRYFACGNEDGRPGEEEEEHVEALFEVLGLLYNFNVSDYMPILRWFDIEGNERAMKRAIQVVDKYHMPLIEKRFNLRRFGGCNSCEEPQDLLDVLISVKDNNGAPLLTLEEIKSQVADLTYASVDNPSNAVEWAMAEMLVQQEIMRKAVEEIDRVVGRERLVEEADISQLNYVKACCKEAMRLHPVAPFNLPHVAMEDATVAGYHIPKGSHVILSRVRLGRNPAVWDDPLRFWPDRFMNSLPVELTDPELRLISFSTGRRGCMGAPLGSAMTVMLMARLLQCFNWEAQAGEAIKLEEAPTDLFMAHPLHCWATPRLAHHVYSSLS